MQQSMAVAKRVVCSTLQSFSSPHLVQGSKKNTCGSTVFSTGHPRQYSLAPAMLVCADRTRRGRFIAVWPQMKTKDRTSHMYPSAHPRTSFRTCLTSMASLLGHLVVANWAQSITMIVVDIFPCTRVTIVVCSCAGPCSHRERHLRHRLIHGGGVHEHRNVRQTCITIDRRPPVYTICSSAVSQSTSLPAITEVGFDLLLEGDSSLAPVRCSLLVT